MSLAVTLLCPGALQAEPLPTPPVLKFAFEERVLLRRDEPLGKTHRGLRNRIGIVGGSFAGPRIRGTITTGEDLQLIREDGCSEIDAKYAIRTVDGVHILVQNVGLACAPQAGRGFYFRAVPTFEAPAGKYDWLNRTVFVSTGELEETGGKRTVIIRFFEVL